MAKFCKNCGAYIEGTTMFCPDCGRPTLQNNVRHCHNCGSEILENEHFCRNCGVKIEEPKEGFLVKYKNLLIVVAVIIGLAFIGVVAVGMFESFESQDVQVDSLSFSIPGGYTLNEGLSVDENDDGLKYVSRYWENFDDYIQIDVMYSTNAHVDENKVASEMGGDKMNFMGYDGYYNELSDAYSFTFVKDNKLVTVFTSNYNLFNEIEVF